ncbi:SDR family NAD(P)-dependent oxidoreductase [Paenibacillus protaetiae]|uniref:SDR family oxidoreductase n=1 Tax=Paenibacillus protaetiae TaxID=2509456 RepID=A0A4V0YEZ7_9BACL|nr:SDR family oxidoreductase [Paenibacillus protaetiae]QAY65951.1 SDR family oxidoreductase [Paenibacillus protaetiae]
MSLTGKTALVTGAGTGIGKGIALEMARRGAKVAVHYNQSEAGALATKQAIEAAGGEAFTVQADVAVKADIDRMTEEVAAKYGGVDILVNNAALQLNKDLMQHDLSTYDRTMNINLKGYWQCMQAVVPYMKANGFGRIIHIASVHAKRPTDFDPVYAMTKGGIRMLAREAAIELAPYGITVNAIEPGAVDVGKQKKPPDRTPEEQEQHLKRLRLKFPGGRVGLPHDVALLACFIASSENEFLNGAAIRLDGGSMLL